MRSVCLKYILPSRCLRCQKPVRHSSLQYCTQKTDARESTNPFIKYLQSLKWVPIPLGVGFAYIGYQQYGHVVKREKRHIQNAQTPEELVAKDWQVKFYRALPLKAMSRLWGRANSVNLPEWLRTPLLKSYIWAFSCKLEEAAVRDLKHYRNLGEFFRRRLTPGCRPVDQNCTLISPSDGKVLHFGKIDKGLVEQVKGVTYTLQGFLGPVDGVDINNNMTTSTEVELSDEAYHKNITNRKDSALYHCVIYLAPGDYHGFHSPTQWEIKQRRHFPGDLLSVNPGIARWIKGLFNLNERAVYLGNWEHGFFCMAAVGATNVGSIKVYHDQELETNLPGTSSLDVFQKTFSRPDLDGIVMRKGEPFGEFNLGSTIVLVFEAPKYFRFNLEQGQTIKYGEALGESDKLMK